MIATSVEEIKEHLAKGGKVFCTVVPTTFIYAIENHHVIIRSQFALNPQIRTYYEVRLGEFNPSEWELEPLEEETHRKQVTQRLANMPKWQTEAIDAACGKTIPRRFAIFKGGVDTGACDRIRNALLHGNAPPIEDLLLWWEIQTGEKIELDQAVEENKRELKRLNDEHHQMLSDSYIPMVQHINKLEAILSNIAVMVGEEPSKDPFECEQRILDKLSEATARTPLDDKLDSLRECIANGSEEDALEHLCDLIKGLRCKHIPDKELTRRGLEKKAWWNER